MFEGGKERRREEGGALRDRGGIRGPMGCVCKLWKTHVDVWRQNGIRRVTFSPARPMGRSTDELESRDWQPVATPRPRTAAAVAPVAATATKREISPILANPMGKEVR